MLGLSVTGAGFRAWFCQPVGNVDADGKQTAEQDKTVLFLKVKSAGRGAWGEQRHTQSHLRWRGEGEQDASSPVMLDAEQGQPHQEGTQGEGRTEWRAGVGSGCNRSTQLLFP